MRDLAVHITLIAVLLRLAREDRTIQQYLEMLAAQPTLRSPNDADHAEVRAGTLSSIIRQSRLPRNVLED